MGSTTAPLDNYCAVLNGPYGSSYELAHRPLPSPLVDEALIRLDYSGVCHGDVYSRDGGGPAPLNPNRPLIGGHEGIGEIVSLGTDPSLSSFRVGDIVGVAWRCGVCGDCGPCRSASENNCLQQRVTGFHRDGTFQRYIAFPVDHLVRIPTGMDKAKACPILCAGVTVCTSLRKMRPQPGKWCVVVGAAGGLGHLAIQYAKFFGLKVLAIDGGRQDKEDFCRKMGCDAYVDFITAGSDLSNQVREATFGGADYTLVLSPYQTAYDAAGEYARFQGQIMAIGVGNCYMPLRPVLKKDLTIHSHETGTQRDIEEALQICSLGKVSCSVDLLPLSDLNSALDKIKRGDILGRLVLDLSKE
ncbi:GroES-like protein [Thozetella sp. PMI_491]|nr:GroES-like protein [Thozetella sp. PMI_491]